MGSQSQTRLNRLSTDAQCRGYPVASIIYFITKPLRIVFRVFVLSSLPLDYDTATLIGNGLQGTISGCQGMKETHDIPSPEFKTNFFKVFEYYVSIVFSCIPFRHISEKCFIIS